MNIMIIAENPKTINNFTQMMARHAHLYSINDAESVNTFLKRDDITRFDLILIAGDNKLKAVDNIKAKLPKANLILINNEEEIVKEADVIKIVDLPIDEQKFIEIFEETAFIIDHNPSDNVIISCFKSLSFKNNITSKVPIGIKWRTMKAKELFSYLLMNSNEFQSKKTIQDMFWSDLSEKSVTQQLYSTVYEIRKTIEKNYIPIEIINSADKYMLMNASAWVDYKVFEEQLKQINNVTEENVNQVKDILELYTGHLFETEDYEWAFNKREELRFLWIIHMEKLRDFYVDKGKVNEAIMLNLKMREFLPNNLNVKENLNELYSLIGESGI